MGCTPLHLVAGQTNVSTVTALLEALVRSLTPAEARVAHTAWLQAEGGAGTTPAAWFAALHADSADVEKVWTQDVPAADKSGASSSAQPAGVQPPAGSDVNSGAAATDAAASTATAAGLGSPAGTGQATAAPAAVADAAVPSMWRLVREAWRWSNLSEYEAWATVTVSSVASHTHKTPRHAYSVHRQIVHTGEYPTLVCFSLWLLVSAADAHHSFLGAQSGGHWCDCVYQVNA